MSELTRILRDYQAGHLDWPSTRELLVNVPYVQRQGLADPDDGDLASIDGFVMKLELAVGVEITRAELAEVIDALDAREAASAAATIGPTINPYVEPAPARSDPNMITEDDLAFLNDLDEARGLTAEVKAELERDLYRPAHLRRYDHETPDSDLPDDFEVVLPDGRTVIVYGSFRDPAMPGPSAETPTTSDQPDGSDGNEGEAADGRA